MSQEKYIGTDVHQAISVAVMDGNGKLLMECLLETKAATILEFVQGLRGTLSLTFEEGTSAAWLHDLLKPHLSPAGFQQLGFQQLGSTALFNLPQSSEYVGRARRKMNSSETKLRSERGSQIMS